MRRSAGPMSTSAEEANGEREEEGEGGGEAAGTRPLGRPVGGSAASLLLGQPTTQRVLGCVRIPWW